MRPVQQIPQQGEGTCDGCICVNNQKFAGMFFGFCCIMIIVGGSIIGTLPPQHCNSSDGCVAETCTSIASSTSTTVDTYPCTCSSSTYGTETCQEKQWNKPGNDQYAAGFVFLVVGIIAIIAASCIQCCWGANYRARQAYLDNYRQNNNTGVGQAIYIPAPGSSVYIPASANGTSQPGYTTAQYSNSNATYPVTTIAVVDYDTNYTSSNSSKEVQMGTYAIATPAYGHTNSNSSSSSSSTSGPGNTNSSSQAIAVEAVLATEV